MGNSHSSTKVDHQRIRKISSHTLISVTSKAKSPPVYDYPEPAHAQTPPPSPEPTKPVSNALSDISKKPTPKPSTTAKPDPRLMSTPMPTRTTPAQSEVSETGSRSESKRNPRRGRYERSPPSLIRADAGFVDPFASMKVDKKRRVEFASVASDGHRGEVLERPRTPYPRN